MAEHGRLRRVNIVAGAVHAGQAAAVLALANGFSLPVTGTFMDGPPALRRWRPLSCLNSHSRGGWRGSCSFRPLPTGSSPGLVSIRGT